MEILGSLKDPKMLVLDIDNTIYHRTEEYLAKGSLREIELVSDILGFDFTTTEKMIAEKRRLLSKRTNRKVTLTETVYRLGITPKQWSSLREQAWEPEKWLKRDNEVSDIIKALSKKYFIAFATNSPVSVGRRIVRLIGITDSCVPDKHILGPENLGTSKPDARFFSEVANIMQIDPKHCISIGDRKFSDGPPALKAGYAGAVILLKSPDNLVVLAKTVLLKKPYPRRKKHV